MPRSLKSRQENKGLQISMLLLSSTGRAALVGANEHGDTLLHMVARNRTAPYILFREIMRKGVNVIGRDLYTGVALLWICSYFMMMRI